MFDGKAFDGIGQMLTGLGILAGVGIFATAYFAFFHRAGEIEPQFYTTEPIQVESIEITQEGDTLYHYNLEEIDLTEE